MTVQASGNATARWREIDLRHHLHPFTDTRQLSESGGSRIINYVAKTLVAILDWGYSPQQAIELGHFVNRNGTTDLEAGTPAADLAAALVARGHTVKVRDLNSGLHAIRINADKLVGGADPRREGLVMGD